jgi:hypothetical protein
MSQNIILDNEGRLELDEIIERDKRLQEELRREIELTLENFKAKAVVYAKEYKEREERERLERIERAKQKEIDRVEQLKKHNNYNDTFIDPLTNEETPTINGIILDTKLYSISTLRTWINQSHRFPRVPHSKQKLNDEEIELIGGIHDGPDHRICPWYYDTDSDIEYDSDSDSDYNYEYDRKYNLRYEYESIPVAVTHHRPPPPPPPHIPTERTMTWDNFVTFMRTIPSYFSNNTIDNIVDVEFVISSVLIIVTIRRYSQNANGSRENVFDIHINVDGERFYKREIENDTEIDVRFLHRVKRHRYFRALDV